MKEQPAIQKFIAFLLVVLFTFSITPKKYWHDLLANHDDINIHQSAGKTAITKTGFNCHCDDLVVKTPFVQVALPAPGLPAQVFASIFNYYTSTLYQRLILTKTLRGPPAMA